MCMVHVADEPTHLIEYETMVMGRHVHMGARSGGGIARRFRITGRGARRLEKVRAETIGFLDLLMVDWTTREVADFAAYLKRFNADIERMDGRPWPRPEEYPSRVGRGG